MYDKEGVRSMVRFSRLKDKEYSDEFRKMFLVNATGRRYSAAFLIRAGAAY